MKEVIFAPNGLYSPESEVLHAIALERASETAVDIYYCKGGYSCPSNPFQLKSICSACKEKQSNYYNQIKKFRNKYPINKKFIPHKSLIETDEVIKSNSNIREIEYKSTDSGYATLSTFIALTRDFEPDTSNVRTRKFLNNLYTTYVYHYDFVENLIKSNEINRIHLWNGRMNTTRAILRAGQKNKIHATCHESAGRDDRFTFFDNVLPHDIKYNQQRVNDLYDYHKSKSIEIAKKYYKQKRLGNQINDKSYVNSQEKNKLPDSWDNTKKNIVFFSSSEDEYKSISSEWEQGLFNDQVNAVIKICELSSQSSHIYLRIHPNVTTASKKYKKQMMSMTHPKLTVISPESKISSYALMESADLVISYGSTIGLEASYWGKVSILIGASFYMGMGGVYEPLSLKELQTLLFSKNLKPKSNLAAIKMAVSFVKNGKHVNYVKGSIDNGYSFNNQIVNLTLFGKMQYYFGKICAKVLMKLILK